MMKEWGFYGRKQELEDVYNYMKTHIFIALAVFGGRGYGKTKLLEVAVEELPKDYTTIYMELPDATEKYTNRAIYEEKVREFYDEFRPRFEKTRFGYMLEELRIPENGDGFFEKGFGRILAHVVKQPKTVFIIDEAQNADDIGLIYPLKQTIDTLQRASGQKAGTLVLAGSHQQKMHKMMAADRPLGYRCQHLHLPPFNSQDLLRIGAEHGWLDRPRRFLTMYAALGGVPRLWEDFHRDCSSGTFKDPKLTGNDYADDEKWQESFMQWRIDQLRQKPETQYLNPQYVDLPKHGEEILGELSNTHPGTKFRKLRNILVTKRLNDDDVKEEIKKVKKSLIEDGEYEADPKGYEDAEKAATDKITRSLHAEMNKSLGDLLYTLYKELRIVSIYDQPGVENEPEMYGEQRYNDVERFYISQPNVVFESVTKEMWEKDEPHNKPTSSDLEDSILFKKDTPSQIGKENLRQINIREGRAFEKLVMDWFRTSTGIGYRIDFGIRGFDLIKAADGKSTSKSLEDRAEIDLVVAWRAPDDIVKIRVFECKRSIGRDEVVGYADKIKDYAEKYEDRYINKGTVPYDLKAALITPDGDNFELLKDEIKQVNATNSHPIDVELWDLNDLAELMKLNISPFPESAGKESENKHEGPNPPPYDDDELTP